MRVHSDFTVIGLLIAVLGFLPGCGSANKADSAPAASIGSGAAGSGGTKAESRSKPVRPPEDQHPKILFSTSVGDVVLKLDGEKAPQTVRNFVKYVNEGHFDQTILHQVVKGSLIVGGTYDMKRAERKTHPPILNEAHNGLKNHRGTIAMARRPDAVDSATSQFFLNLADNIWLDHKERTLKGYGLLRVRRSREGVGDSRSNRCHGSAQRGRVRGMPVQPVQIRSARVLPAGQP